MMTDASQFPACPLSTLQQALNRVRKLLEMPDNDFVWSSWSSGEEALAEFDRVTAQAASNPLLARNSLQLLFAPTGPIQEVSISSGWGTEFLALAAEVDSALERL